MREHFVRYRSATAVGMLSVLVLLLSLQNRSLAARRTELLERDHFPRPGLLVPTFQTSTVDGATLTIGEAPRGDRQLLFVFTRTCEFCRQSVPAWRSLIHAVQNDSTISVVAVTLDSLEHGGAWAREHGLPVPVVRFSTPKIRALYRAGSVPITLLIDERGQVDFALVGALLNGASLDSLRNALGAKHDPSG